MPIVLIIFGVLLLLFGGGCTVIVVGILVEDPERAWSTFQEFIPLWIPLGLLPLIIGGLLLRWGVKSRRAKREEK